MSNKRRRTYETWRDMHRRCNDTKNKGYHNYGGRGIAVCERWTSFELFLADMGCRPEKLTIERVDVNQGYDPFNCIWATKADNNRNTRKGAEVRRRRLENPPMEAWERKALRQIAKPVKPPYVPDTPVHGSKKMYLKHKCRCDICVQAMRARRTRIRSNATPEARQKKLDYLKEYRRRKRNDGLRKETERPEGPGTALSRNDGAGTSPTTP